MKKVLAFGDSVMKGVIFDGDAYHISNESFASLLASEYGFSLSNYAKMGHTIKEGIDIFNCRKKQIGPNDLVLLEFGGNDSDYDWSDIGRNPQSEHTPKTDIRKFVDSYCGLIEMIKDKGAKPLLFSLPPLEASWYFRFFTKPLGEQSATNILKWLKGSVEYVFNWHEQYNLAVFQVAIKTNTPIVDISTPILSSKDYRTYLCQDGIHPNQDGHRAIFNFITSSQQWIEKLINKQ